MDIELPNGVVIKGIPEGTSKEEIRKKAIAAGLAKAEDFLRPNPEIAAKSGLEAGVMDPINAGAQFLEQALPEPVSRGISAANNWLVDRGVPLARIPEGGVDQMVREGEMAYQQRRAEEGDTGMDWDRLAGNIASPANLTVARLVPQAATLAGRVGAGAAAGGAFGAAQPVTQGDFWEEKGKQAALGSVTGAALPAVAGGIARVVRPNTSDDVQALMREGVRPTPGQIAGGAVNRVEEKMMSMPVVGDFITAARRQGIVSLNRAALNRALEPIGEALPKAVDVGRGGVRYVERKLGDAYNALLPNLRGQMDDVLKNEIQTIRRMAAALPPERQKQLNSIIKTNIERKFTDAGLASGVTLKEIESKLGDIVRKYSATTDGDQRLFKDAVRELQASIRRMVERVNPEQAGKLQPINRGWANFTIIRDAASRRGAKEGVMSPANLAGASRAADRSVGKGRTAKGEALMQDLTDAGENVLATTFPNSGTVDRGIMNALALGGGYYIDPMTLAAMGGLSLPYLPGVRGAASHLMATRPQFAEPVADLIRKLPPYIAPGAIAANQGLLAQ